MATGRPATSAHGGREHSVFHYGGDWGMAGPKAYIQTIYKNVSRFTRRLSMRGSLSLCNTGCDVMMPNIVGFRTRALPDTTRKETSPATLVHAWTSRSW